VELNSKVSVQDERKQKATKSTLDFCLFEISIDCRDHSPEVYAEAILPGFRAMNPGPKIGITRLGAGEHSFWKRKGLTGGHRPMVIESWKEAVTGRYFVNQN
jgi:hypothetical protein